MDFELALQKVMADPRYVKNIEFGQPRAGHPEGKVRLHLADLEANLERLKPRLSGAEEYWKLKFLIHVHDTLKAEARPDTPILDPRSHASLARAFAQEFTDDEDVLNIVQFHDENYALWKQFNRSGNYDRARFGALLDTIKDWDLFLIFITIDGSTPGKDVDKILWFIREVRLNKETRVDETWVPG